MLLIKDGRVIDPGRLDAVCDIYIEGGVVFALVVKDGTSAESPDRANIAPERIDRVVDAAGKLVVPGLIDIHVHLREPGQEYKETIATGCRAAAAGGFTAVCCMPNTDPVNDSEEVTRYIIKKAALAKAARVYPVAAVSRGLAGRALADFSALKDAGAVAFTDDGCPVSNSLLMRRAMEYASGFGLPVMAHSEDLPLAGDGVMNEGAMATRLGLAGIPNAAESVMVIRDIALCELTGAHLHVAHVSTAESVRAIRAAKERGLPVTAETAPHYFMLTDSAVDGYNTHAKMNPPLRSEADRDAIRRGLADGTLDVIATDHAPHSVLEKQVPFDQAANGIVGLETALPLSLQLVRENILSMEMLVEKMAVNPARILGLPCDIREGQAADLTIIDPERRFVVNADNFVSLGRNTPFEGWEVQGAAAATVVNGVIVFEDQLEGGS